MKIDELTLISWIVSFLSMAYTCYQIYEKRNMGEKIYNSMRKGLDRLDRLEYGVSIARFIKVVMSLTRKLKKYPQFIEEITRKMKEVELQWQSSLPQQQ